MAYDEDLAARVRELVSDEAEVTEKKMFGGLAFLVGGRMAVAASGQGGLLVRVDPASSPALVATTTARPMEMRGRPMDGWLRVDGAEVGTRRQLLDWVERGVGYARSLGSNPEVPASGSPCPPRTPEQPRRRLGHSPAAGSILRP